MQKSTRGLIIAGSILSVVLFTGVTCYGTAVGIKNQGVRTEQALSATYEDGQNYLSNFILAFHEVVGIANLKTAKLDTILNSAVRGRYGEDGFKAGGSFFSAVVEAYPDLSQLNIYNKIVTQIQAGREGFKGHQSRLLDQLRSYDTWRLEGFIRPLFISFLGFPSENLKSRIGGEIVATGPEALEQFRQLVLSESAVQAFSSGRMEPLIPK